ncbi:unnamed protein product [Lactuca saligna]|uniref:Uncharacterized protein n=1 Tax=Lactuca saligna TaxID=75948 RepID=A0AA35Z5C8_LACSI|nr:unnamed protein product [Lactuca saligna]
MIMKMLLNDDQGKCCGAQGDRSCPHEGNIGKNDVEGKGDVNDHAYEDDVDKNNDFLNEKDNEDDEQRNGSGFNEKEAMKLNSIENVRTVNFGEDDHKKEVILDHTVDKVIVEKKKEDD